MAEPIFDHDRLDVYRLSIDYVASSFSIVKDLNGLHRHARAQWLRAVFGDNQGILIVGIHWVVNELLAFFDSSNRSCSKGVFTQSFGDSRGIVDLVNIDVMCLRY